MLGPQRPDAPNRLAADPLCYIASMENFLEVFTQERGMGPRWIYQLANHPFISPRVLAFLVAPLLLGTAFTLLIASHRCK